MTQKMALMVTKTMKLKMHMKTLNKVITIYMRVGESSIFPH